ncbi:Hypothetical predicted protein [Paramuricea clavata]|uniref:Uncharacterized protein n=1 Tax=Paramuricea clavata TaxID=317549 RepID=A0A6S7JYY7_PARCT|nr:Hypothetical predicted protein [Paramuricea clavata]
MKLNPRKCKEMLCNFMLNPNIVEKPIFIGDQEIERVSTYKLLGVVLSDDLKWNSHIDYIVSKASKRLYDLRLMKWAGAKPPVILKIYKSTVRPILEYAVQVWQSIPGYLSGRVGIYKKEGII